MSTPKSKKSSPWLECDSCGAAFSNKDAERHTNNCPPNAENPVHSYIKNGLLIGDLDVKKDEDIKGLSPNNLEDLIFLSQSALQLCGLSIGDWVVLRTKDSSPIVKKAWPTVEKSLTSVLLTKNVLDLYFGDVKSYPSVSVTKLGFPVELAKTVQLKLIGTSKSLKFNNDLINRISQTNRGKILACKNKISIFYFGKVIKFLILSVTYHSKPRDDPGEFQKTSVDDGYFKVSDKTSWDLHNPNSQTGLLKERNVPTKIGGLNEEMNELQRMLYASSRYNTDFGNIKFAKAVLLYGNSGTGKTVLANAVARESKRNVLKLTATDLYSRYSSSPEDAMKVVFEKAISTAPSVIIMDEVDLLCPLRSSRLTDTEKRLSSTLMMLLDDLYEDTFSEVFIIATTNRIDSIDPCFRRSGRFEREIEIGIPSAKTRKDILEAMLSDTDHYIDDKNMDEICSSTHGFVGADLMALCSAATLSAIRCCRQRLFYEDFQMAMKNVRPSAMREVQIEVPNVKWDDVAGQDKLKLILRQAVMWPLQYAESFSRLGVTPPRGVLMFGPPGCSKTMIARAVATESKVNFLSIKGPELFSKWVGESERAVRDLFRKARQVAPSLIFFDEIDALGCERSSGSSTSVQERVLAQLLTELDGVTPLGNVSILAATNRPDRIDKALLRPGRLDRIVYVPLPDAETRREIINKKLLKIPTKDVDVEELVGKTENHSGAEVAAVCNEAAIKALEDHLQAEVVKMCHFENALKVITPRTPLSLLAIYEEYNSSSVLKIC